jgi:hypothetical protein
MVESRPVALVVTATGTDRRGLPAVPPALLEAVVLARPAQLAAADYRARMLDWIGARGTIDVMVVGGDHPAAERYVAGSVRARRSRFRRPALRGRQSGGGTDSSGSDAPIKMLDALARGVCVSVSEFVDRALNLSAYGLPLAASPRAFAADILTLLSSREARAERIALAQQFAREQLGTE